MAAYKYCIVPMCENTSKKDPQKMFLHVPKDKKRRKIWCQLMKRKTPISSKSTCYVCEDHFDMLNDTENYMRVKMMGGNLIQKPSAAPHIFHCQKRRPPERPLSEERKRKALIQELLRSSSVPVASNSESHETIVPDTISLEESAIDMGVEEGSGDKKGEQMPNDIENYMQVKMMGCKIMLKKDTTPHIFECQNKPLMPERPKGDKRRKKAIAADFLENEYPYTEGDGSEEFAADINADKVSFKHKGVQARGYFRSKATQVNLKGSKFVQPVQQDQSFPEKQKNIPPEPVVGIKEEPADPTPSTSNTDKEEYILPHVHSPFSTSDAVVESQLSSSVSNISDSGQLKKKQRTDSSGVITNASESTSVSISSVVSNHTAISNRSSSNDHCKNKFEGFGSYVADKLNCLDTQSAIRAQKAIENILLEAEMGKYLDETQDIKPSIVPF